MSPQSIITILILIGLGLLMWKGPKNVRSLAGFLLIYSIVRIVESSFPGNGFNDFIRGVFQGLSRAFGNVTSPGGTAELVIAVLALLVLAYIIWQGGKGLRAIAGFIMIYAGLRILEVGLFGDGFNDLVRGIFQDLSNAFGSVASQF